MAGSVRTKALEKTTTQIDEKAMLENEIALDLRAKIIGPFGKSLFWYQ